MNVLQIVLTICTIGMFILSLALIRLVFKRFRQVFQKKSIRPSSIDRMLFMKETLLLGELVLHTHFLDTTKSKLINLMTHL